MATHSSTFAWKIPWMEEPGGLQSMGLQSRTRLSDFTFFHLVSISLEKFLSISSTFMTLILLKNSVSLNCTYILNNILLFHV